ncbi:MAG: hypothetical protein K0R17_3558 [Rariglobus sp.]|jgi:hypothetical protein|nr:hypothetical protein [Rariglobus sp.]
MAKLKLSPTDERAGLPSASAFQRYDLCPGSWNAAQLVPAATRNQSSVDAAEGTMLHEQIALRSRADIEANSDLSQKLSHEQRATLLRALNNDAALIEQYGITPRQVDIEKRLFLHDPVKLAPVASGKFDRVLYGDFNARVLVIDYKFGRGDVESAELNHQLRFSAAVLDAEHGPEEVIVAINQPRADGGMQVTSAVYTRDDLVKAREEVFAILEKIRDPNAPRIAGYEQCKYCPARGTSACPESIAAVAKVAGLPDNLNPSELAEALKLAKLAERVIEAMREQAKTWLAIQPDAIPGWLMKPGQTRKSVTDAQRAFNILSADGLVTQDEFVAACSVKLTDLVEIVAEKKGLKVKAAREAVETSLRADFLIDEKTTAPSLAEAK